MNRRRDLTDLYLRTVEAAVADPGRWVEVPRLFATEMNAAVTGYCLEGGYLRVKPRGDERILVNGKAFLRTAAPVDSRVEGSGAEWKLHLKRR